MSIARRVTHGAAWNMVQWGAGMNVSVIMPTYQRGRWIGQAIRSVLPQREAGDELIVIDEGSTDSVRPPSSPPANRA